MLSSIWSKLVPVTSLVQIWFVFLPGCWATKWYKGKKTVNPWRENGLMRHNWRQVEGGEHSGVSVQQKNLWELSQALVWSLWTGGKTGDAGWLSSCRFFVILDVDGQRDMTAQWSPPAEGKNWTGNTLTSLVLLLLWLLHKWNLSDQKQTDVQRECEHGIFIKWPTADGDDGYCNEDFS